jgi:hypothetical protein
LAICHSLPHSHRRHFQICSEECGAARRRPATASTSRYPSYLPCSADSTAGFRSMPPLIERPGARIRPCPPLEPSPAGLIAHTRIASSTRQGLLWSAPSGPSGQSIDPARPGYISFETDWDSAWVDAAIPAMTEWMRLKGPSRRAQLRGFGEAQMRETLRSLGKHSWDLESYVSLPGSGKIGAAEAEQIA